MSHVAPAGRRRRQRRGSNAVEFALTLPVYLALFFGITDYGWYFSQRMKSSMVARDASRAASLVPLGEDVESAGEAQGTTSLAAAQLQGTVDCVLAGSSPEQRVTCTTLVSFVPLIGMVPVPDNLNAALTMRMEEQP